MRRRDGDTLTGTVKNIVNEKGFGFILVDGGTDEYFFHMTACTRTQFDQLQRGTRVQFTASTGAKGPRAENVSAI